MAASRARTALMAPGRMAASPPGWRRAQYHECPWDAKRVKGPIAPTVANARGTTPQ